MKYLSIDVGGSGIKYAIIDSQFNMIMNNTCKLKIQTYDEFIMEINAIYEKCGRPNGGIAISYCGELNEQTGLIFNGGSYSFITGKNIKTNLEDICKTKVSVENDGNCAALAELHKGVLRDCKDSVVVVIGTGLGGAVIFDRKIRHGINKFAGSLSFMASDIGLKFNLDNMTAKKTGYYYLVSEYNRLADCDIQTGYEFFDLVNNKDEISLCILSQYSQNIANVLFNIHLLIDIESIAVGGGISIQPIFEKLLFEKFEQIFITTPIHQLNIRKPDLFICQYHNDSNLYGALCHHLNL